MTIIRTNKFDPGVTALLRASGPAAPRYVRAGAESSGVPTGWLWALLLGAVGYGTARVLVERASR
jgi:hypothetical protein